MRQHRAVRLSRLIALLVVFLGCTIALPAQTKPQIPDDVRAILAKARSGAELTEKEEARLEEFAESMQALAEGRVGTKPGAMPGGKPGVEAPARPEQCPKAGGKPLPSKAPSHDEYVALLKSLVDRHGKKAGDLTSEIDGLLSGPGAGGGSELGAMFHLAGVEDASIYASAKAALKTPWDPQLANNLGVSLTAEGETADAARVFLYALTWQPGAALVELNLGWAQFEAGQLAAAETQFGRALARNPELAGAEGGLGMVCACRGDAAGAKKHLEASLKRRYSSVFAGAFRMAQSQLPPDALPPPQPGPEPELIPEIPVAPERKQTRDARPALEQLMAENEKRTDELAKKLDRLLKLVLELNARNEADPGSAMVFPRVFEREIFEFTQVGKLAFGARMQAAYAQVPGATAVIGKGGEELGARAAQLSSKIMPLLKEHARLEQAIMACGDVEACEAPLKKQMAGIDRQVQELNFQLCEATRQQMELTYTQLYKMYAPQAAAFRIAAADFYTSTDPILERVYAPALNEYLAALREALVRSAYQHLLLGANVLAENALGSDLECDPPPANEPAEVDGAELPKGKEGDCPVEKPQKINLILVTLEFDCDKVAVSAGKGLMARVEYRGSTDETTIWVGAGVSAGGTFGDVPASQSDSGSASNILPKQIAPNVTLEGKAGFSITARGGKIIDGGFGTSASGSVSVAGVSVSGSIQSGVSVEGGLKFGGQGGYQLPGGGGASTPFP
jgi:tetratricopeptide (TPR) repeat protein